MDEKLKKQILFACSEIKKTDMNKPHVYVNEHGVTQISPKQFIDEMAEYITDILTNPEAYSYDE